MIMSAAFSEWVGRQETARDCVTARQARQMAATLEVAGRFDDGDPLPALWHWMGWTPEAAMSGLGPDGHPARGGFLPPVPLERRMWAGGRLTFLAPLVVGEVLERRSEILKVVEKTGTTGRMVFVTVGHEVTGAAGLAIREEQDIVYVAMPDRYAPPPPLPAASGPDWQDAIGIDTVRLFRFSALTFNAHRIHFDLPYATQVEKYPGLVVHGPLQAMLLMQAARVRRGNQMPASFQFRGTRPLFHHETLTLQGQPPEAGVQALATVNGEGMTCMQAAIGWVL
jgi:3-methylfumaryl-CoA hydratase